ncbi:MAG: MFS transporter [Actinobacteria bacterium]|nr:MFS transporter [Actinomycetota bacterium]
MSRSPRANIRRLALGRLISVTGGAAAYTALMFTIWHRTHSATVQSVTLLLTFGVVGIAGPLAGALGDRFDRRKVMIWSEAGAAAIFGVMAFVTEPRWLIGLAFASALAESPFYSASRAAIPNLAERDEDIAWANSLISIGVNAGVAIGPVLGGLLVAAVGASWVFGLNAVSFLVSLAFTLSVRGRYSTARAEGHEEHRGIMAGLRFIARERVLRLVTLAWVVFLLGMGMGMVADAALAEAFGAGSTGFGLMIACWGTGSVLGSVLGRRLTRRTEPVAVVAGCAGVGAAGLAVGFSPTFAIVLGALFLMGTCDGLQVVAEQGLMQRRSPDAVRSRVLAAFDGVLSLGLAVAYLAAGPVLHMLGPKRVYAVGGAGALLAGLLLLPLLELRRETGGPGEAPGGPREVGEEATLPPPVV